ICLLKPQAGRGSQPDREIRILGVGQERLEARSREVVHSSAKVNGTRKLEPPQPGGRGLYCMLMLPKRQGLKQLKGFSPSDKYKGLSFELYVERQILAPILDPSFAVPIHRGK